MSHPGVALQLVADNDVPSFFSGLTLVDHTSSDEDIIAAIDFAGDALATAKPMDREWDWRECEKHEYLMKVYAFAYIRPEDISVDPLMKKRLGRMVMDNLLEGSSSGTHVRVPRPESEEYRVS